MFMPATWLWNSPKTHAAVGVTRGSCLQNATSLPIVTVRSELRPALAGDQVCLTMLKAINLQKRVSPPLWI